MKEISKVDFYNIINDLDICVHSSWNNITQVMTTEFTYRNGKIFGYSYTNYNTDDEHDYLKVTYFVKD